MRMVQSSRWAEHVQRAPTLYRLSTNHCCADYQRGSLVQLVGDGIICGSKAGFFDEVRRHARPLLGIAQLAHEIHISRRVDELELRDCGPSRRQPVSMLDHTC